MPVQLGQFLLIEQMGTGGMGAVYRAMDAALGRFVAIKVMKAEMGEDPALVESFLREARAAAALNHPNIVQIYSCGQEQGQPYIVMELVSGGRLDLLMADGKKVGEVRLLEVALDVAEGLKAANEAGLVHGDIKPANVLFDKNGRARIVDFGLAMFVNRQQEQGGVWGTPYYISPERARGGKADHRSDIYSLGATMFHALAGRPPFDGKTAADVVVARLKGPPPKLSDVEPEIQQETSDLVERMMAADPVLRYPTSASLLADMRRALSVAREAHSPAGMARRHKKKDWSHLVVLACAVIVVLALAFLLLRHRASPPPVAEAGSEQAAPVATSEKSPAADGDAEEATIEQTEGGRVRRSVTFFEGDIEKELVQACAELDGNPGRMVEQLSALSTKVPANSARMMWLRALQALPLWAQGEASRADELLRQVAALPISQRRGHPIYMPQVLALYLIGDLREDRFARERRDWPMWYADLAGFFTAAKTLLAGDVELAAPALEAYARNQRAEPAWAYGFRPVAEHWLDALGKWEIARRDILAKASAGQLDEAQSALDAYTKQTPAFLKASTDLVQKRIQDERDKIAFAAQQEKDRARRVIVQRDLDRIDAWLADQIPSLAQQKDFRKVSQDVRRLEGELETPEGKEQARIVREQLERMDGLKTVLTRELEAAPFRQPDRELGGDAIGANVLGVRISSASRGITTRPWEQISPRLFVRLLTHIAENAPDAKTHADRLLTIAILSAYYGGHEAAAGFAAQARELDPSLDETIRRLFPEGPPASEGES